MDLKQQREYIIESEQAIRAAQNHIREEKQRYLNAAVEHLQGVFREFGGNYTDELISLSYRGYRWRSAELGIQIGSDTMVISCRIKVYHLARNNALVRETWCMPEIITCALLQNIVEQAQRDLGLSTLTRSG
jgi:hypothetical protein